MLYLREKIKSNRICHTDPLLSGDSVHSGRCYITPTTYMHTTNRTTGLCNPFLSNGLVNNTNATIEELCFPCGPCWDVVSKRVWNNKLVVGWSCLQFSWVELHEVAGWWVKEFNCQLSVGHQPVKKRLGGQCEMATSLEPS
jgi:NAD-dependent dihydropyrimidine dehydrogenase PreA subunit